MQQEPCIEFTSYGLHLETQDRSKADNAVQKAFIKEDSFGTQLTLLYPRNASDVQKVQIKLEIDWDKAKSDVVTFLRPRDAQSIQQWATDFFMHYLQKIGLVA